MNPISSKPNNLPASLALGPLLLLAVLGIQTCSNGATQKPWHSAQLTEEFTAEMINGPVTSFNDYLVLEDRLFRQLDQKVYATTPTGPEHALKRYSRGSLADPARRQPNWNRSYQLPVDNPVGGVLLLHGLTDSPYTLKTLGMALNEKGYWVIGLRLPGHGTAPSGLRSVEWRDMAAAVKLAADHLASSVGSKPIHLVGYSTGAPLAMDHTLESLDQTGATVPASLILISPAIRVHASGALAGFKDSMAILPGLDGWAYLALMDEFDPYKYNSFATNAAAQVHRITRDVDRRIQALANDQEAARKLPPILVFKSTVDSTVTTEAVVDNLLARLPEGRNELVLFDINRNAALQSMALIDDPGPLTNRLMNDQNLPFTVTFVTNESPHSEDIVALYKAPFSAQAGDVEELDLSWPRGVVSLSHVALPIPPGDLLYGQHPAEDNDLIFLGDLAIKGERGILKIPGDWLLRLRYNPFYDYLQSRVLHWLEDSARTP